MAKAALGPEPDVSSVWTGPVVRALSLGFADFLADKPFMLGDAPSSLDATAHAFLANLLWAPVDSVPRTHLAAQPALVAYCERMRGRVGSA